MRVFRLAPAAILALGCGQILGVGDYHPQQHAAPPDASPDGAPLGSSGCGTCLARSCTHERSACDADPWCAGEMQCELACKKGDVACASACAGRFEAGLRGPEYWKLLTCRAEHCPTACALPCNGLCTGNGGCDECISEHCENPATSMVGSPGNLVQCEISTYSHFIPGLGGCTDATDAGASYRGWSSCLAGSCGDECGLFSKTKTPDWRCLDDVPPVPVATLDAIDVEVRVVDGITFFSGSGLLVRPCFLSTLKCASDAATTDSNGTAMVHARRGAAGFFDYLEIADPTGAIDPSFAVYYPPVMQNGARIPAVVMTKADMDAYYAAAGATFHRDRFAQINIVQTDCGVLGGGLGLYFESPTLGGKPYYVSWPDFATHIDYSATTALGEGGFFDVDPGANGADAGTNGVRVGTFTARRVDTKQLVASVKAPVAIGHATWILTTPTATGADTSR